MRAKIAAPPSKTNASNKYVISLTGEEIDEERGNRHTQSKKVEERQKGKESKEEKKKEWDKGEEERGNPEGYEERERENEEGYKEGYEEGERKQQDRIEEKEEKEKEEREERDEKEEKEEKQEKQEQEERKKEKKGKKEGKGNEAALPTRSLRDDYAVMFEDKQRRVDAKKAPRKGTAGKVTLSPEEERGQEQVRRRCGLRRGFYAVDVPGYRPYSVDQFKLSPAVNRFLDEYIRVSDADIERIFNYKQDSPDWHENKKYRLGGSTLSTALENGYKGNTPDTLVHKMIYGSSDTNEAMLKGQKHEPDGRRLLLKAERKRVLALIAEAKTKGRDYILYRKHGYKIPDDIEDWTPEEIYDIQVRGSLIRKEFPWIACSTDGDIWLFGVKIGIIEVKVPRNSRFYTLTPSYYYDQLQGNMFVHKVDFCLFTVYIAQGDMEAIQVDYYQYDPLYCHHFLLPLATKFYFEKFIPAVLAHLNSGSSVPAAVKKPSGKKKADGDNDEVTSFPCSQRTPSGIKHGTFYSLPSTVNGRKRPREYVADYGYAEAMGMSEGDLAEFITDL